MPTLVNSQAYVFLWTIACGMIIGIIYDFFRVLRKFSKPGTIAAFFQDILFWIIVSLILFFVLYISNNGEVRFYVFIGAALGAVFYFLILSSLFMNILLRAVGFLSAVIKISAKIIVFPLFIIAGILKAPSVWIVKIFKRIISWIWRVIKYHLGNIKNLRKVFGKITKKV